MRANHKTYTLARNYFFFGVLFGRWRGLSLRGLGAVFTAALSAVMKRSVASCSLYFSSFFIEPIP